ncbi:hypothetical protein GCM10011514_34560 [Emticicia aquatilis]|uniref:DUF4149 domain-containing protein n=1 Tax=Emticicia aquatilis TaxID=1537369 RepID=A0A916YYN3_9BACT|nr:hypothetical protein [Emticicia aquatilis]GGD67567.1 hypothetical protein GCM10011514_34560 [Emticicia aquatilis]
MENNTAKKISMVLLCIWWGAFTFYSGVVINVGMQVLGSHTEMGFITQAVTNYLNFISLPIFAFAAYAFRAEKRFFIAAIFLVLLQVVLFFVHFKLDKLLDFGQRVVLNKAVFYSLHRIYLWTSTVIWLIVSGILLLMIKKK